MVFFHTSANVKILRNILIDYGASKELTPLEYMKSYMEKCPENIQDSKITWIVKTFLDIQKHGHFLKSLAAHLSEQLTEEEQDYFMILFHATIFQTDLRDKEYLYKCMFNLSKTFLSTFTTFLGNNEVLTFISHVAQTYYDTKYITDKIIAPLFEWQPYISEMGHSYGEYVQKIEQRKIKPKTIPIQPNVLNRKIVKNAMLSSAAHSLPATPPNSLRNRQRKMVTKSMIDKKLKQSHERNKQRAAHLLNDIKKITEEHNFAQSKSDKSHNKLSAIRDEIEYENTKPLPRARQKFVIKHNHVPVKETTTTLKRMNKRVELSEQDEIQWLNDLMTSCKIAGKVEELMEYDKQENEKQRIYEMERKHLEGQISYEEAIVAKKKLVEENKKKREEFIKEKETWDEEIENWKRLEMEKNRKHYEHLSLLELNLRQAKMDSFEKKKALVDQLKKESEIIQEKIMIQKRDELQKRANMIKEIKILAMVARRARVPRIIDLTETSGVGLLCEMSMAELHERLNALKMGFQDELKRKRNLIQEENMKAKLVREETKESINNFLAEQALIRKKKKKSNIITLDTSSAKNIDNLKNILEEKKKLRAKLSTKTL